jgi:hypothetical protein
VPTWVALLRGINIGGKNLLPMTDCSNWRRRDAAYHIAYNRIH